MKMVLPFPHRLASSEFLKTSQCPRDGTYLS